MKRLLIVAGLLLTTVVPARAGVVRVAGRLSYHAAKHAVRAVSYPVRHPKRTLGFLF